MLSRPHIVILALMLPFGLVSQVMVDCPAEPDTIVRTCLPVIPDQLKDFVSNNDEDRVLFEAMTGRTITNSTTPVIIRVIDQGLPPFPVDLCDDIRTTRRVFRIFDGDPQDPSTVSTTCVLVYKAVVPFKIRREGPYPIDTISCSENVQRIFNDYVINWGYIELDSCSVMAGNTRLDNMIPSVPSINYSCGDQDNPGTGFVRIQFDLKDDCENILTIAADFYVEDNEAPTFTNCPDDLELDITNRDILTDIADYRLLIEAVDNCNDAIVIDDWDDQKFDPLSCETLQEIPIIFTAVDDCGNENNSDCIRSIKITNDRSLEFTCPPNVLVLECKDGMDSLLVGDWLAGAEAINFRGDVINAGFITNDIDTSWFDQQICFDEYAILLTVTDICGSTATCTQDLIIQDTSLPELVNCPQDTVVNADSDSLAIKVEKWLSTYAVSDLCNNLLEISSDYDSSVLDFACGDQMIPIRLYADDNCNPIDSFHCIPVLTIQDNIVAEFTSMPADTTIECQIPLRTDIIDSWASTATASNNLNQSFSVSYEADPASQEWKICDNTIEIPFTFEDQCGDIVTQSAFITLEDTTVPEIICPNDTTMVGEFQDLANEISEWLGTMQPSDNCGFSSPIADYSSLRFDPCAEKDSQIVSIVVVDDCDNRSETCTTLLRIESQKRPSINCPEDLEIQCGEMNNLDTIDFWLASVTAQDFNGNSLDSEIIIPDISNQIDLTSCFDTLTVSFSVTNPCDYEEKCTSFLKIEDSLNPNVSCPSSSTVNTTSDQLLLDIENWLAEVQYDDNNCFTPTMTHTLMRYDTVDWCKESGVVSVEFLIEDPCDNKGTCTAELTIINDIPSLTCPPLMTYECGDPDNYIDIIEYISLTEAFDNNDQPLSLEYDPMIDFDLSCVQEIEIQLNVEDNCTGADSCIIEIQIIDSESPIVDCPSSLSLLSGDPDKAPKFENYIGGVQFDDCTDVSITTDFNTSLFNVDCMDQSHMVNVIAEDECGNTDNSCSFEIIISNNVNTSFNNCDASNNLTIECNASDNDMIINDWFSTINAVDNLGNEFPVSADITLSDPRLSICGNEIVVTFSLIDFCNSSMTCSTMITVEDNNTPLLTCPRDTTFMFGDQSFNQNVQSWLSSASASDDCDMNVDIDDDYVQILNVPPCEEFEVIQIEFIATDDCTNSDMCTSILKIRTATLPIITCPGNDIILECGDNDNNTLIQEWLNEASGVDADGSELNVTWVYDDNLLLDTNCETTIPVTFNIEDDCGIKEDCVRMISILDRTDPAVNCPDELIVNSSSQIADLEITDWISTFSADDNCSISDSGPVDNSILSLDPCVADESILVEFFATDVCDARSTCTTTLTINNSAPVLDCGTDLNVQCGDSNEDKINEWISNFSALDNDNTPLLIQNNLPQLNFGILCEESVMVEFEVKDVCGNVSSCVRTLSQIDTLAPAITNCPPDVDLDVTLLDLDQQVMNWLDSYTAEDGCATATLNNDYNLELTEFDCGQSQSVIFTAIDECGNVTSDCNPTIIFSNELQVGITCPQPVLLTCNEPNLETDVLAVIDDYIVESEDDFVVESDLVLNDLDLECTEPYSLVVTLTVTDDCLNSDDCETILDFFPAANVYIPNSFSPLLNGDDSRFKIFSNIAVETITSMEIYDRWGDLAFIIEDFDPSSYPGWDGRNTKGDLVSGVYAYIIKYTDVFGNEFEKLGSITLLR